MTKQDLVAGVAKKARLSHNDAREAVEATVAYIKEAIARGDTVELRGFGTFGRKHRAEKKGRNIAKNTPVIIPARDVPYFKPSKAFTL
jgi:DNA-binding protein HU-beta